MAHHTLHVTPDGAGSSLPTLLFALVLLAAERRRTLHQLTLRRMAAWGGVGSMLMSVAPAVSYGWSLENGLAVLGFGLLGAGSAAGSLAVARRATAAGALPAGRAEGVLRVGQSEEQRGKTE